MKETRDIFFDLDHTLWDYNRASSETLSQLHDKFQLDCHVENFVKVFQKVNSDLWHSFNLGLIDKSTLRESRFNIVFQELGLKQAIPDSLSSDFIEICSAKPYLFDHAQETLSLLYPHFRLHIITNGFIETQTIKLKSSGIRGYFQTLTTSEHCGKRKPDKAIFEFALNQAQALAERSVMIGDNYMADILGALDVGMSPIFFSPDPHDNPKSVLMVSCLSQIPKLFF
jgi:putative hydrolase of the HAD superfamily